MGQRVLKLCLGGFFICLITFLYWSSPSRIQENVPAIEDAEESLKNWIALCASCHSLHGTGTSYGPAIIGATAKKYTHTQLVALIAVPEDHGIPEAIPPLRKLTPAQRNKMALWLLNLKNPEDIVVAAYTNSPAPFLFLQNCAGCHGPDAKGTDNGSNLINISSRRSHEEIVRLIADPKSAGIVKMMPPFDELSETERTEIADWLRTLK